MRTYGRFPFRTYGRFPLRTYGGISTAPLPRQPPAFSAIFNNNNTMNNNVRDPTSPELSPFRPLSPAYTCTSPMCSGCEHCETSTLHSADWGRDDDGAPEPAPITDIWSVTGDPFPLEAAGRVKREEEYCDKCRRFGPATGFWEDKYGAWLCKPSKTNPEGCNSEGICMHGSYGPRYTPMLMGNCKCCGRMFSTHHHHRYAIEVKDHGQWCRDCYHAAAQGLPIKSVDTFFYE